MNQSWSHGLLRWPIIGCKEKHTIMAVWRPIVVHWHRDYFSLSRLSSLVDHFHPLYNIQRHTFCRFLKLLTLSMPVLRAFKMLLISFTECTLSVPEKRKKVSAVLQTWPGRLETISFDIVSSKRTAKTSQPLVRNLPIKKFLDSSLQISQWLFVWDPHTDLHLQFIRD